MKVLCLGKCFQLLIKEKLGLSKDEELPSHLLIKEKSGLSMDEELPSHLIPTIFKEETSILEDEGIVMLKEFIFLLIGN